MDASDMQRSRCGAPQESLVCGSRNDRAHARVVRCARGEAPAIGRRRARTDRVAATVSRHHQLSGIPAPGVAVDADGRAIEQSSRSATLCSYQVDQLRSIVAIVDCVQEMYVVWLSATLTRPLRPDGFVDDTDVAQATPALWSSLGLMLDLTWLERA